MHRTILLLLCASLGGLPGCAKRADYASEAPAPEMATMDGMGGAAMGEAAPSSPSPAPPADYGGKDYAKREYSDEDASMSSGGAAPTTVTAAPAKEAPKSIEPRPKQGEVREGKGREEEPEPQKQVARQIIYTAEMAISVFKLDEAMERAEALALETGGYVQSMSQGYYILRIPAAKLRGVMAELGKLGVVESRSLQAQDVTEEFVDLTTRIRVLRETQQQLLALLKQARNVEEALNVRRSLDQITMELEQAMGRLRMLESLIGFSTLTVRMSQRGPQNAIPSSNDPFPWVDGLGVEATEWN